MSEQALHIAVVCPRCERASIVPELEAVSSVCADCGSDQLVVPGGQVTPRAQPLFLELERVIRSAALSKSEAALIAAELESVGSRWEPPELVLDHLAPRLPGLRKLYDAKQDYSELLLVAGLLLVIVCARLVNKPPEVHRTQYPSGFRKVGEAGTRPLRTPRRRRA
jgi:hypothetical protein